MFGLLLCPSCFIAFVMSCLTVCVCLWGVRLQACPFVQPSLLTKLIIN